MSRTRLRSLWPHTLPRRIAQRLHTLPCGTAAPSEAEWRMMLTSADAECVLLIRTVVGEESTTDISLYSFK